MKGIAGDTLSELWIPTKTAKRSASVHGHWTVLE
jgi:hypothetical protein